ncbi:hypothetical protein GWC95_17615 [Sediminibacterium roseum]|uniref:IPT/TIG domain-containing protein n=1 Tax=Sediminibacterium roseum TaxID=1978412 RepID=A0ABX0A1B8_9BACT|nr:IPT/TIG domain-containing protein [Sediminibacterium roseum]NCI51747.1 hypothetical protein [Sediminibacterium roseum]
MSTLLQEKMPGARWLCVVVAGMIFFYMLPCSRPNNGQQAKAEISFFAPQTATDDEPVKISGKNFKSTTAVQFGGAAAKSFKILSDTVIFAYVATGTSGDVSVVTPNGTAKLSGFTYYTPQFYDMTGTTKYAKVLWPQMDSSTLAVQTVNNDVNTVFIRQINRYDTASLQTQTTGRSNITAYVDSPNYVRLFGINADPASYGPSYKFAGSNGTISVFAELKNGVIRIPVQMPGYGVPISGSGTLVNNKLTLNYYTNYRGQILWLQSRGSAA